MFESLISCMQDTVKQAKDILKIIKNREYSVSGLHENAKELASCKMMSKTMIDAFDIQTFHRESMHLLPYLMMIYMISSNFSRARALLKEVTIRKRSSLVVSSGSRKDKVSASDDGESDTAWLQFSVEVADLGKIRYATQNLIDMIGVAASEIEGTNLTDLIYKDFKDDHFNLMMGFTRAVDIGYLNSSRQRYITRDQKIFYRMTVSMKMSISLSRGFSMIGSFKRTCRDSIIVLTNKEGMIIGGTLKAFRSIPNLSFLIGEKISEFSSSLEDMRNKYMLVQAITGSRAVDNRDLNKWLSDFEIETEYYKNIRFEVENLKNLEHTCSLKSELVSFDGSNFERLALIDFDQSSHFGSLDWHYMSVIEFMQYGCIENNEKTVLDEDQDERENSSAINSARKRLSQQSNLKVQKSSLPSKFALLKMGLNSNRGIRNRNSELKDVNGIKDYKSESMLNVNEGANHRRQGERHEAGFSAIKVRRSLGLGLQPSKKFRWLGISNGIALFFVLVVFVIITGLFQARMATALSSESLKLINLRYSLYYIIMWDQTNRNSWLSMIQGLLINQGYLQLANYNSISPGVDYKPLEISEWFSKISIKNSLKAGSYMLQFPKDYNNRLFIFGSNFPFKLARTSNQTAVVRLNSLEAGRVTDSYMYVLRGKLADGSLTLNDTILSESEYLTSDFFLKDNLVKSIVSMLVNDEIRYYEILSQIEKLLVVNYCLLLFFNMLAVAAIFHLRNKMIRIYRIFEKLEDKDIDFIRGRMQAFENNVLTNNMSNQNSSMLLKQVAGLGLAQSRTMTQTSFLDMYGSTADNHMNKSKGGFGGIARMREKRPKGHARVYKKGKVTYRTCFGLGVLMFIFVATITGIGVFEYITKQNLLVYNRRELDGMKAYREFGRLTYTTCSALVRFYTAISATAGIKKQAGTLAADIKFIDAMIKNFDDNMKIVDAYASKYQRDTVHRGLSLLILNESPCLNLNYTLQFFGKDRCMELGSHIAGTSTLKAYLWMKNVMQDYKDQLLVRQGSNTALNLLNERTLIEYDYLARFVQLDTFVVVTETFYTNIRQYHRDNIESSKDGLIYGTIVVFILFTIGGLSSLLRARGMIVCASKTLDLIPKEIWSSQINLYATYRMIPKF